MTVVWHYVLPMLLGRTYDMKTDSPGVDIFPQSAIDGATVIEGYFTDSQYRMVSDTQDAREFLEITGDLSLKIKAGRVDIKGFGSYLKESYSRINTVEILIKVHYETVTYTIPSSAQPRKDWRLLDKENQGTHYARSITYGGDLVASLKFTSKNKADREKIKAIVQGKLQSDSGSFNLELAGNFSQLQEELKDTSTLEINYYATVPVKVVPNTIESLLQLVQDFPSQTQLVNNGMGVPLRMELFPLSALDSSIPRYLETQAIADVLDRIGDQFDDLRSTKSALFEWMMSIPPLLTQKSESEIGEFNSKLEDISKTFYEVLSKMDLSEGIGTEQFDEAFAAYSDGGRDLPDKYYRKYILLRDKLLSSTPALSKDVGGTTYIHWGKSQCNTSMATHMYNGMIATTERVKGGSSEIICLSKDPKWYDEEITPERHPRYYSMLSPVLLKGRDEVKEDESVSCSMCSVKRRTSAVMLPAKTTCPSGWTTEYTGYIMTKEIGGRKGDFICADKDSEVFGGRVLKLEKRDKSDYISDVRISCGILPCENYIKDSLIPCSVCTY